MARLPAAAGDNWQQHLSGLDPASQQALLQADEEEAGEVSLVNKRLLCLPSKAGWSSIIWYGAPTQCQLAAARYNTVNWSMLQKYPQQDCRLARTAMKLSQLLAGYCGCSRMRTTTLTTPSHGQHRTARQKVRSRRPQCKGEGIKPLQDPCPVQRHHQAALLLLSSRVSQQKL